LLRRLLAQHPDILAGFDTGVAPSVAFQWRNFATSLGSLHQEFFFLNPKTVSTIMGRMLEGALRAEGEKRIIFEKTSLNIVAFEAIGEMLPGAKFIHVVRDGRDVAASLMSCDWRHNETGRLLPHVSDPVKAIEYWSSLVSAGLAAERKLGQGKRIIRVRYEDLASNPEDTMLKLCEFIGLIPSSEETLCPLLAESDYRGMERDSLPLLLAPLTRSRIHRHKHDFSPEVIRSLEQSAGPVLAALGY
jgi:hypothetical protein